MSLAETLRELRPELVAILRAARKLEIHGPRMAEDEIVAAAEDIGRRSELARMVLDEAVASASGGYGKAVHSGSLSAAVEQVLVDLEPVLRERSIEVVTELADDLLVRAGADPLADVLRTLLIEVLRFIPSDTTLELTSQQLGAFVLLHLRHRGDASRLAERMAQLTSVPAPGKSLGAGDGGDTLAPQLVRAMVRMLDGLIAVETQGEAVTITLVFHRFMGGPRRVITLDEHRAKHTRP